MPKPDPINILLVEDDPGDALLAVELLGESKISNTLTIVEDGEAALRYLRKEPPYQDAEVPDLVLLDLNLPKITGHEVLRILKTDPVLRLIPVVVLTTSGSDADVEAAYSSYANCYITKPVGLDQLHRVVQTIDDFWFSIVRLPRRLP